MSESEIKQLIKKCLKQERNAQKALYETFYGFSMGIALRYCNNRHEATKIINDGFLKVFTHLNRYNDQFPFKAWLRKIMVNTSIDYYRRNLKTLKTASSLDLNTMNLITNEEHTESKLNYKDLLAMVQKIPPAYRVVFNLYAIEGYTHQEISEILNITTWASKFNLLRARAKLIKEIDSS